MEDCMTCRRASICILILMLSIMLGRPATVRAQSSDTKLSDLIFNQYFESVVPETGALLIVFPGVPSDFVFNGLEQQFAAPFAINSLIGAQVSGFPLGSSAGGFTWTFDPAVGSFNRVSNSFGPVFAERALTVGRHALNVGVNYQHASFDRIHDISLDSGDITTYTGFTSSELAAAGFKGTLPTAFFEDRLFVKLKTNTVGLFATYGVLDRLDVGIAIPIIHADMETRLDSRAAVSFSPGGVNPSFSTVTTGKTTSGTASGIGDIVLRTKYNVWRAPGGGIAAGLDWRLPTGDELDLLGVAGTQAKFYVAASGAAGRLSPHVNLGFTVSGESEAAKSLDTTVSGPADEFNYAGGIDVAVTPRLTVVGDVVGRNLRDTTTLAFGPTKFGSAFNQFAVNEGNLNVVLGSAGVKFNPRGKSLVSFNLLFPLNHAGLTDNLSWMLGTEFSF
jgi:hypothetical protein